MPCGIVLKIKILLLKVRPEEIISKFEGFVTVCFENLNPCIKCYFDIYYRLLIG